MKCIGIMQILQESNSFNPVKTTIEDFERFGLGVGKEVIEKYGDVDEIGGFLAGLKEWPEKTVNCGILRAQGWPSGLMDSATIEWFTNEIHKQLTSIDKLDGILVALHGAMVGENCDDVDGYLLKEIRNAVGPDIPIVATLDLHAHCTPEMREYSDVLVAYQTSPHLDRRETGIRAANVLYKLLNGAKPASAFIRLPMISIAEVMNTSGEILGPIYNLAAKIENMPDVLSVSVLMTQGWLDVPNLGWSVEVVTDSNLEKAQAFAQELAEMCWKIRPLLSCEFFSASESVEQAIKCHGKPVVIADGADATNSGACGDSTHLLKEMINRDIPEGSLLFMVDPDAVEYAQQIGIGGNFEFEVGGKRDYIFSQPLFVSGKVLDIKPAKYVMTGHGGNNLRIDMGMSATVQIGDVTLLLVQFTGSGSTPMMYRCVGLEPKDYKIVVVKSPAGFRADYEPFAAGVIVADCPGCASPHFDKMPYTKIFRPLWPLDEIEDRCRVNWT